MDIRTWNQIKDTIRILYDEYGHDDPNQTPKFEREELIVLIEGDLYITFESTK